MKSTKKSYIKSRHKFFFPVLRAIVSPITRLVYNYREVKFPLKKGEQYLFLSNHQTVLDPVMMGMSLNVPIFILATDTLFKNKLPSFLLKFTLAPVPKRKAMLDIGCIRTLKQIASEGGNILVFPEGNRTWTDELFPISPAIAKLVRMIGLPVALYNIRGGFGTNPRWGGRMRRGKMTGEVVKILNQDKISQMSDEALKNAICEGLRVRDTESNQSFKSKKRAEFLERLLFVCPSCKRVNGLFSEGNFIRCKCGCVAEYTEKLALKPVNTFEEKSFQFDNIVDWYAFQQNFIKEFSSNPTAFKKISYDTPDHKMLRFNDDLIFWDDDVTVFDQSGKSGKVKLGKGTLALTTDYIYLMPNSKSSAETSPEISPTLALSAGAPEISSPAPIVTIPVGEISYKSVVGGVKLLVGTDKVSYFIIGHKRFNAIKYVLVLNLLNTLCKEDIYYGLGI